jgi:hypothetical protein
VIKAAQAQRAAEVARTSGSAQVPQLNERYCGQDRGRSAKAAEREVKRLRNLVDELTAEFETAHSKTDSPIPTDEVIFVPSFLSAGRNQGQDRELMSGPVVVLTNNNLAIDSSLPLTEAPLVKPGMKVAIDEPDLGLQATGVVSRVADTPGTDGADGYHVYFEVLVDDTQVKLEGVSLRLTIPVESTGGAVTVVPISALFLAADGTSRVQVEKNGKLDFVEVKPGLSADGFVEVTPVNGTLSKGQLVLVGYEKSE